MKNLFRDNQRNLDIFFMLTFLGIFIILALFLMVTSQMEQQIKTEAQDQLEFRVYVNSYNKALYEKVIERKVSDMLKGESK